MTLRGVIAIDGPAASGKSSVARAVAERLGWVFVNTGNMFRAVTWVALQAGADVNDPDAVEHAFKAVDFAFAVEGQQSVIRIDGQDIGGQLTSEQVNKAVSQVSAVPAVRDKLAALQRDLGQNYALVMEGRDIGSVVFPDTPWKFYISASEEVRAQRRGKQGLADSVTERDRMDSSRKVAPLTIAPDAVVIDSSNLSIDEVVESVLNSLRERGLTIPVPTQNA